MYLKSIQIPPKVIANVKFIYSNYVTLACIHKAVQKWAVETSRNKIEGTPILKLVLVKRLKVKKIIRKSQNSRKNWSKKIVKKFHQNNSSTNSSKNFVKKLVKKTSSKQFYKKIRQRYPSLRFLNQETTSNLDS